MKPIALFHLFFALFVVCVRSQRVPSDILHKISTQLRTGTLAQLPLSFQSVPELRDRLVRFMDNGDFEEGKNMLMYEKADNPFIISSLNKMYASLNQLGITGLSRKSMLNPFQIFKYKSTLDLAKKKSFHKHLFRKVVSGELRPFFALFWVEDDDVLRVLGTLELSNSHKWFTHKGVMEEPVAYSISVRKAEVLFIPNDSSSDDVWWNRINQKLHQFPITEVQKHQLVHQKHRLAIDLAELWLMKDRQFPIQKKQQVSSRDLESYINLLAENLFLKDFIEVSKEDWSNFKQRIIEKIEFYKNLLEMVGKFPASQKLTIAKAYWERLVEGLKVVKGWYN